MVEDAKKRVKEVSASEAKQRLQANPKTSIIDVREDNEWAAGHAKVAQHLGRGVLDRDIES